jgi:hypothetical protein
MKQIIKQKMKRNHNKKKEKASHWVSPAAELAQPRSPFSLSH